MQQKTTSVQTARVRRRFLLGVTEIVFLAACQSRTAGGREQPQHQAPALAVQMETPQVSLALSLTALQAQAVQARSSLPKQIVQLETMNRIHGFLVEPDGEIILLGAHEPALPALHVDDLAVALRNAYQVSAAYQGVLGCTIDPWAGAEDPWRIQQVTVFGMPPSVRMAARHVFIDFELKKVSAGLLLLARGVPSLHELDMATFSPCAGSGTTATESVHRFWFAARYPQAPRFSAQDGVVLIDKPVGVQLLTEQAFLDRPGRRTDAAPASPVAEHFAQGITDLLASDQVEPYVQLRNDFRLIEVAQLFRHQQVPATGFNYLLYEHKLTEVKTPSFVVGIRREEQGEVVCNGEVSEQQTARGTLVSSKEQVHSYHFTSRGGVEAKVEIVPTHFGEGPDGLLADLRTRVRASRPSTRALVWEIPSLLHPLQPNAN
jgi:hypothetical protein